MRISAFAASAPGPVLRADRGGRGRAGDVGADDLGPCSGWPVTKEVSDAGLVDMHLTLYKLELIIVW